MSNKKYYAIKQGKKIGIFDTWDEAKLYVIGYKGAIYKSFKTLEEAEAFLKDEDIFEKNIENLANDEIIAYVDGSYNIKTHKFGYGIVLISKTDEKHLNGSLYDEEESSQRNVAGEIYGAVVAIKEAIAMEKSKIYIFFDYMGIKSWADGTWKANLPLTQKYKEFIQFAKTKIDIVFIKVKAHSNDKYNDLADSLAKKAVLNKV